jgi:sugar diacid utilization regulator
VERAKELNVELAGEYHVLVCDIEGLDMPNDTGRLTGRDIETRRRSIAAIPGRLAAAYRTIRFSGLRGSELVVVGMFRDARHGEEIAHALMAEIGRLVPAATPKIGISRGCSNPMAMPEPFRDARIALAVARHGSGKRVVAFHDAGIAGLLMSMREGPDFQSFIREKLGRLLLEKNPQRDVLLNTLHVFFKTNCSQQATAQELRTHQKTIAYRLDKVSRITGIDLSSHEDRVLLYLALKMNELIM